MPHSHESRWFKVFAFIISGFVVGVSIANIIYFNRLRKKPSTDITSTEATSMLWVNIVILVISSLLFIFALWKLIFSQSYRAKLVTKTKRYFTDTGSGFTPVTTTTPAVAVAPVTAVTPVTPVTQPTVTSTSVAGDTVSANAASVVSQLQQFE